MGYNQNYLPLNFKECTKTQTHWDMTLERKKQLDDALLERMKAVQKVIYGNYLLLQSDENKGKTKEEELKEIISCPTNLLGSLLENTELIHTVSEACYVCYRFGRWLERTEADIFTKMIAEKIVTQQTGGEIVPKGDTP